MSRTLSLPTAPTDQVLEQLNRLVPGQHSLADLVQEAVRILASVMPADTETSLVLQDGGTPLQAATGPRAQRLDEAQFDAGRGPGVQALRAGVPVEVADVRVDARWPEHAARAAEVGLLGSLSVPLLVDARTGGALTVWAARAGAFEPATRERLRRLAPHVRAAVVGLQDRSRARTLADDLESDLEARAVIGRAKGILAERYQLSPERAVELLLRMSARSRMAVRDVAVRLVRAERDA
jgi:transcriptional regulator with GAF, ATPase, and Fis domain